MPLYGYECRACGATYDRLQGTDAPRSHSCEECGEGEATRQLTAASVLMRSGAPRRARKVDTSKLPVVGPDGKLYSADGKKVLRE